MALKLALTVALTLSSWSIAIPTDREQLGTKGPAIVGGQEAQLGDFPYIISLTQAGQRDCGGSLLNSRTVVTAAHCVHNQNVSEFRVRAGTLHWNKGGKVVAVASMIQHPEYNPRITENDIAILHLAKPIEKSYTIGYATLPEQGSDPVAKSTATIAGWGDLEFGGLPAENLMKVSVPIVARQTCKKQYAKDNPPLNVTDNMFCAGLKNGGKDSCQGDSGGPIIDKETGVLIGVVSWGKQCALAGFPGVYTRIGNYIPFIAKNLAKPYRGIQARSTYK